MTFYYAQKGGITIGRVPPRSVLYLLCIKQDQKILKFNMSLVGGRPEHYSMFGEYHIFLFTGGS